MEKSNLRKRTDSCKRFASYSGKFAMCEFLDISITVYSMTLPVDC